MKNSGRKLAGKQKSEVEKLTFRLWSPYTSLVAERAKAVRLTPNQFARVATMSFADNQLLEVQQQMSRIEDALIRLRKDFNNAVE